MMCIKNKLNFFIDNASKIFYIKNTEHSIIMHLWLSYSQEIVVGENYRKFEEYNERNCMFVVFIEVGLEGYNDNFLFSLDIELIDFVSDIALGCLQFTSCLGLVPFTFD